MFISTTWSRPRLGRELGGTPEAAFGDHGFRRCDFGMMDKYYTQLKSIKEKNTPWCVFLRVSRQRGGFRYQRPKEPYADYV